MLELYQTPAGSTRCCKAPFQRGPGCFFRGPSRWVPCPAVNGRWGLPWACPMGRPPAPQSPVPVPSAGKVNCTLLPLTFSTNCPPLCRGSAARTLPPFTRTRQGPVRLQLADLSRGVKGGHDGAIVKLHALGDGIISQHLPDRLVHEGQGIIGPRHVRHYKSARRALQILPRCRPALLHHREEHFGAHLGCRRRLGQPPPAPRRLADLQPHLHAAQRQIRKSIVNHGLQFARPTFAFAHHVDFSLRRQHVDLAIEMTLIQRCLDRFGDAAGPQITDEADHQIAMKRPEFAR